MPEHTLIFEIAKSLGVPGVLLIIMWLMLKTHESQIKNYTEQIKELLDHQSKLLTTISDYINYNTGVLSRLEKTLDLFTRYETQIVAKKFWTEGEKK
jgi:hypothetical protein